MKYLFKSFFWGFAFCLVFNVSVASAETISMKVKDVYEKGHTMVGEIVKVRFRYANNITKDGPGMYGGTIFGKYHKGVAIDFPEEGLKWFTYIKGRKDKKRSFYAKIIMGNIYDETDDVTEERPMLVVLGRRQEKRLGQAVKYTW